MLIGSVCRDQTTGEQGARWFVALCWDIGSGGGGWVLVCSEGAILNAEHRFWPCHYFHTTDLQVLCPHHRKGQKRKLRSRKVTQPVSESMRA